MNAREKQSFGYNFRLSKTFDGQACLNGMGLLYCLQSTTVYRCIHADAKAQQTSQLFRTAFGTAEMMATGTYRLQTAAAVRE